MKKIITSFLMAILAIGAWAADPEVVFDLTTQTNFDKCTQYKDGSRYTSSYSKPWSFSTYYGPYDGVYSRGVYALATPEIEFEVSEYSIKFNPYIYSSSYNDGTVINILLGQGDDLKDYQNIGRVTPGENSSSAPEVEVKFVVETAGSYMIAFETSPYGVYLYKTKVYKYGESSEPRVPTDFKVLPDSDGGLSASISFTMPDKTLTGQDLVSATYTLYKGDEKIKDKELAELGKQVLVNDEVYEEGYYTYYLEIESNDLVSKKLEARTWVGPETATAPTEVKIELKEGKYLVNWKAPEVGVHGAALQPSKLTYKVTRFLGEDETVIADGLTGETSIEDEFEFTGLHKLKYTVCAKYGDSEEFTEAEECKAITIGFIELPFADSFAGATLNPNWEQEVFTSVQNYGANFYWQAKENCTQPTAEPYDNDGGLLFYNSYNVQANNSCRISTPPVGYNASDNPVLSFARFQQKTAATDILKVQVRCDYGEWVDVPDAEWLSGGGEEDAWHFENISLSNVISPGTKVYEVAFFAYSLYKYNMAIDAVNLFNQIDNDLAIDAFTVSEKAHAGDNLSIMVRVANKGVSEVAADAYSVEIDHNFTEEFEIGELQNIPSLGFATYEVTIPVHSLHLYQVEGFEFTAKVNFDSDQDLSNNESETHVVEASYSAGNGTQITKSTYDKDGNYYLYWEPAFDPEYTPVNIVESFEDSDNYDYDRKNETYYGPFNGWVTIDRDMAKGAFWYSVGTSQFSLCENVSTPGSTKDGNNVIGATLQKGAEQDDWIISPEINCKEGSTMDLSFLFGVKQNTSSGMAYELEILYTTDEEYSMEDPISNFTHQVATGKYDYTSYAGAPVKHDNKMYPLTFTGIPAEAKYVAIHFITSKPSYDMAMWVDKIELVEHDENPFLGYHVYSLEVGGRLNEEIIGADKTEFKFKPQAAEETEEPLSAKHRAASLATGEPMLFVSAVYADGEAKAKNVWNYADQSVTGIENVAVDSAEGVAEYYNLQGMKVSGDKLTPGIYIIRTGKTSQKVMVK